MTTNLERIKFNHGPGPGAYAIPDGVTRFGCDIGREYSLGPKLPPPKNYNETPAPIYFPRDKSCKKRTPMGQKYKPISTQKFPAPNAYALPSVNAYNADTGFCLKGRVKFNSYTPTSSTPGPRALPEMEIWKSNPPQTAIGIRPKVSDKTVGPGPAAYRATKLNTTKSKAPAYQFGRKHSAKITQFFLKSND